jgi:hypothetical protein
VVRAWWNCLHVSKFTPVSEFFFSCHSIFYSSIISLSALCTILFVCIFACDHSLAHHLDLLRDIVFLFQAVCPAYHARALTQSRDVPLLFRADCELLAAHLAALQVPLAAHAQQASTNTAAAAAANAARSDRSLAPPMPRVLLADLVVSLRRLGAHYIQLQFAHVDAAVRDAVGNIADLALPPLHSMSMSMPSLGGTAMSMRAVASLVTAAVGDATSLSSRSAASLDEQSASGGTGRETEVALRRLVNQLSRIAQRWRTALAPHDVRALLGRALDAGCVRPWVSFALRLESITEPEALRMHAQTARFLASRELRELFVSSTASDVQSQSTDGGDVAMRALVPDWARLEVLHEVIAPHQTMHGLCGMLARGHLVTRHSRAAATLGDDADGVAPARLFSASEMSVLVRALFEDSERRVELLRLLREY